MYNTQNYHFNDFSVLIYGDIKLQSCYYVCHIHLHCAIIPTLEVLLFHVLEWLKVVVCDIPLTQIMDTTLPFNFFIPKNRRSILARGLSLEMKVLSYHFQPTYSVYSKI